MISHTSASRLFGALLATSLLAAPAASQEHLGTYSGDPDSGLASVTATGDVDGDGSLDHVVGSPDALGGRGRVTLVSGATGAPLWQRSGDAVDAHLGHAVDVIHDLDGDGVPDVLAGAPGGPGQTGRVLVLSGAEGSVVHQLFGDHAEDGFGRAVSATGDVDGDGLADILVGAPLHDGPSGADAGAVRLFSGANGEPLGEQHGSSAGDQFGWAVDGWWWGDGLPNPIVGWQPLGDSLPDPLVGAPQGGNGGPGYVSQLDPHGLGVVRSHHGETPGDRFGASVSQAGDLDGDGVGDLLAGAAPLGSDDIGYAAAVSGADGQHLLLLASAVKGDGFGASVAGVGDVDGDGARDVAVGAPRSSIADWGGELAGSVRVYSGVDGAIMHLLHGDEGSRLGSHVACAGDVDGDGLADVAVAAPHDDTAGTDAGSAFLFSMARWTNLYGGVAGAAGVPRLEAKGETAGGQVVELRLSDARPHADTVLVAGAALVYEPTSGEFVPSQEVVVDDLVTDGEGRVMHALALPTGLPAQTVLYYQFVVADPTGPGGMTRSNSMAGHTP